jgi:hypothetical protein
VVAVELQPGFFLKKYFFVLFNHLEIRLKIFNIFLIGRISMRFEV